MMELLSRHYSKIMGGVALLIIIAGTIAGGAGGVYLISTGSGAIGFLYIILGAVIGFVITYLLVVMVFGFMAQVMSINSKLERIEALLEERE